MKKKLLKDVRTSLLPQRSHWVYINSKRAGGEVRERDPENAGQMISLLVSKSVKRVLASNL